MNTHSEDIKRHECIIDVYKRNIKELYESETHLHDKKFDAELFNHSFDVFRKDILYLRTSIED